MPTANIVAAEAKPQVIMIRAIHSRAPTRASTRLLRRRRTPPHRQRLIAPLTVFVLQNRQIVTVSPGTTVFVDIAINCGS